MPILYLNEHLKCYNHDSREKPQIEVIKIPIGQTEDITIVENEIIFFIEGRVRFVYNGLFHHEGINGEFMFLPAGRKYSTITVSDTCLIIFRLNKAINLCENFMIDKLFKQSETRDNSTLQARESLNVLEINPPLQYFLTGINSCINEGVKCRNFFDIKTKELLFLMRAYYTKEQLSDFFYMILSADTIFSEYVRLKWDQFSSIEELAKSMHFTRKQFSTRFVRIFGRNPNRWMMEARAEKVFNDITSTHKQFKQIAADNLFHSDVYFTNFCKTMLGGTPSQIREGRTTIIQ